MREVQAGFDLPTVGSEQRVSRHRPEVGTQWRQAFAAVDDESADPFLAQRRGQRPENENSNRLFVVGIGAWRDMGVLAWQRPRGRGSREHYCGVTLPLVTARETALFRSARSRVIR